VALHAGIEIDGSEVCIAVVDSTSKRTTIVDYIEARLSGETSEERIESLAEILRTSLSGNTRMTMDIVSSIPTRMSTLREISVPFTRDDVIAKTVRYESEGHLPSASIDDLIIEYIKCSEEEDSSRLLISAIQKNIVGAHLDMLREGDVDPIQIEVDATALATALHISRPDLRGGRTLLIGMEAGHTTFVLLEEGRIARIRSTSNHLQPSTIPTLTTAGGLAPEEPDGDSGVAQEFADLMQQGAMGEDVADDDELSIAVVSDEDFEKLNEELTTSQSLPPADPNEVVERLFTEIERTFAGILIRSPLDRIVVSGSAACDLGIADLLSEEFEVPAQQLRVCDGIETSLGLDLVDRCNRSGAVAVGLSLQAAGQGLTNFDFRKEEHKYERRFAKLLPGLMLMAFILCTMSVSWLVDSHQEKQLRRAEFELVIENQEGIYLARFDAPPRTTTNILRSAQNQIQKLKGGSGDNRRARIVQYLPGLDMVSDVTLGVTAANPRVYPKWTKILIRGAKSRNSSSDVVFLVEDASAAERVVTALEQRSKYFTIEDDIKSDGELMRVTLKLKLKSSLTGTGGRS
jgi:hypothetical protein